MKKMRKAMGKLSALLMVLVLVCSMLPVQADAKVSKDVPVLCVALNSQGEVENVISGVPVISGGNMYMITRDDVYEENLTYVVVFNDDDIVELTYGGSADGFSLFSFNYSDKSVCVYEGQAVAGATYTLQIFNPDAELQSFNAVVTGTKSKSSEAGFVYLEVETNVSLSDYVLPGALLDDDGYLIAVVTREGYIGFAEPVGGSEPQPEPTPAPAPAPTQGNEPEPAPTRGSDPAPTTPTTTPPTEAPDPTEPTPPIKKYILPIAGGVAVVILAVVVLLVKRKPQPQPQAPVQPIYTPEKPPVWNPAEGSVTRPGPNPGVTVPVNNGGGNIPGWESAPVSSMSLVDSSGTLGGRTFPISQAGIQIGRAANADVQYPAETKGVSRNHCRIYWEGNNLMLVDSGSTSGTFLLGKGQLRTNTPTQIKEGDVICLGSKKISLTVKKN